MKNHTLAVVALLAAIFVGCSVARDHVIVSTSTVLGFEAAQSPSSGLYQARLGYTRAEVALVPTNNVDVLTELRWNAIFTTGGLYQRMAVGKNACEASLFMFMKGADGRVDPQALSTAHQILSLRRSTNN